MIVYKTGRGFVRIDHPSYPGGEETRLLQESSVCGERSETPGASYLWVGEHHHLDVEDVEWLISRLQKWVDTGSLW